MLKALSVKNKSGFVNGAISKLSQIRRYKFWGLEVM